MISYRSLRSYKYQLLKPYEVRIEIEAPSRLISEHGWIVLHESQLHIKKGYAWDGPSGPTFDTQTFMRASLVHDALYQLLRARLLNPEHRLTADQICRRHCLEDGMDPFRAWYVYYALRLFGGAAARPEPSRKNLPEA